MSAAPATNEATGGSQNSDMSEFGHVAHGLKAAPQSRAFAKRDNARQLVKTADFGRLSGELPARIVAWYWPSSKRLTFSQIGQDRKNFRRPVGETRVRQIEREAIEFIRQSILVDEGVDGPE